MKIVLYTLCVFVYLLVRSFGCVILYGRITVVGYKFRVFANSNSFGFSLNEIGPEN